MNPCPYSLELWETSVFVKLDCQEHGSLVLEVVRRQSRFDEIQPLFYNMVFLYVMFYAN